MQSIQGSHVGRTHCEAYLLGQVMRQRGLGGEATHDVAWFI